MELYFNIGIIGQVKNNIPKKNAKNAVAWPTRIFRILILDMVWDFKLYNWNIKCFQCIYHVLNILNLEPLLGLFQIKLSYKWIIFWGRFNHKIKWVNHNTYLRPA